jgi:hypothetical protein
MNAPHKKPQAAETVEDVLNDMDARQAKLSASLVKALAEIEGAAKDKVNPHFKSKYADIASVIDAIKPVLAKYELGFTQHSQPSEDGVIVETVLHHASGDKLSMGALYVPANKRDAQGFGSALTYARRYALMTAFGVPAEDDDGNAAAASSRSNPTTGETPPAKRVKLDGPYTCPTQLMTAAREFVRTLESMGDLDEFIAWSETKDYREFCEQLARDMPAWWATGENMPEEFVPLEIRIRQKRDDLERAEGIKVRA